MTELFNRAAKNNCFDNGFNYLLIYSDFPQLCTAMHCLLKKKMKKKIKDPSYQEK